MKKRSLAIALVAVMLLVLAACGGGAPKTPEEVKGETFETDLISALVPNGWKAFPASDLFDEYEGDNDPTSISIYKDAKSELDMFSKPGLTIRYTKPEITMIPPAADWYEDVTELADIKAGSYTWKGFTGVSFDVPVAALYTNETDQFTVNVTLEASGGKITLEDPDVLAILGSIKVK